ncbi:MAG: PAS domain-containing protein, partial [Terracidiphilus sp.]
MHDSTPSSDAEGTPRALARSLQESERIAGIGSYTLELKTMLWSSSAILDEIFGIDPAYQRSLDGWTSLIHPDDRDMMAAYFAEEVLGRGELFDHEYRIVRRNDRVRRWVHGRGRIECDDAGKPVAMHGT